MHNFSNNVLLILKIARSFLKMRSSNDNQAKWSIMFEKNYCASCTVIGARIYISGLVFDPRVNLDEFGDEARYVTLDNCSVPPKDMFVHHVHCIPLPDNCNQTPISDFTINRGAHLPPCKTCRSFVDVYYDKTKKLH